MTDQVQEILSKYVKYLRENEIQYPVSGLDYSSLYPSLIMTYNLSPEYLILDENQKNKLEEEDVNLHTINFEYNYTNYLNENCSKMIKAWTVRHHEENKEDTGFGLYPEILRNLFKQRSEMKKDLFIYKEKKEHIEKYETEYENTKAYKECVFKLNYCDTKQKALKVFMNTFYGEMGNKNSPLFQLPLAGGVTSSGQYNLLLVKKYVENLNHKVYYGDSVIGETPILIREDKGRSKLINIEDFGWKNKKITYENDKEFIVDRFLSKINTEVYTENGWTPIKKMIRHYTNKKLYRITTNSGIITVTEDHSLLDQFKEKIKPEDCKVGTELLHWNHFDISQIDLHLDHHIDYYLNMGEIYCLSAIKAQEIYLALTSLRYVIKIEVNNNIYKLTRLKTLNNKIINEKYQITKIEYVGNTSQYVYDLETESHHFAAGIGKLVVHNTDSLYISCPKEYYTDKDKEYYTNQISKEKYNTDLILITFKAIEDIKVKVNEYLYKDNGTKYLKMSYEEVLYPLAFLSKKKYFGIPHENIPNFKPKDLFIRGLEVKKRGVSEILKIICMDLMWKAMDLENTKSLRELTLIKVKEIFTKKWNLEDFIQTGVWKPEKKNITINSFAERMKDEGKTIPTPGERFNYVIIKKYPFKYDFKGRQLPLKKADKMEYTDVVEKNNYDIDLKYYFDKQLTGQFARLISYDKEFEVFVNNPETDQLDIDDDKTLNNCKKYILQLADKHGNNYVDRNKVFKNIYKVINNKYKDTIQEKSIDDKGLYNKKYKILFNLSFKNDSEDNNLFNMITENINNYLKNKAEINQLANKVIKKYLNKENNDALTYIYNNKKSSFYNQQQYYLNNNYGKLLDSLIKSIVSNKLENVIFNIDNLNIINIIQFIRKKYNIDEICNTSDKIDSIYDIVNENEITNNLTNLDLYINIDKDILNKIYTDYINLISIKKNILINQYIFNNLYNKINSTSDYTSKPFGFKF